MELSPCPRNLLSNEEMAREDLNSPQWGSVKSIKQVKCINEDPRLRTQLSGIEISNSQQPKTKKDGPVCRYRWPNLLCVAWPPPNVLFGQVGKE